MIIVTQRFIIALLLISHTACHFERIKHNPIRAVTDANQFLHALYFEQDYAKARELATSQLRQSVTEERLKEMLDLTKLERGEVTTLVADSYLMTQGEGMEVFYVGKYEKGVLYYRLVLMGNASSGYRVSGVWFQPEPYQWSDLRRKFDANIFVPQLKK